MPELPEVETVRRILETQIIGKKIIDIEVFYDKLLENTDKEAFKHCLSGETFRKILRKGKFLIFILDTYSFVSHLRMEGKYFIKPKDASVEKHEHLVFHLDDGLTLRYHDTRKFGKIGLIDSVLMEEICLYEPLYKLGPDGNTNINFVEVYNKLRLKKLPIKQVLLDQTVVAGIGNIYADEICYLSNIHPLTKCCCLSVTDIQNIVKYTREVLNKAIDLGGTTIRSYTSSLGVTGRFQNKLFVHNRKGEACYVCGEKIVKITVGGRGTYYCPDCQRRRTEFKIVGITGVIGSGKTTVTNYLKALDQFVIDCDEINRYLLTDKNPTYMMFAEEISKMMPEAITDDYDIDRKKIRELIFNDKNLRDKYQQFIFKYVKECVSYDINHYQNTTKYDGDKKIIFVSAPLLIESGLTTMCDEVIIVDSHIDTLIERIMLRDGIEKDDALKAINLRPTASIMEKRIKKMGKPVYKLNNNEDLRTLELDIKRLLDLLKED